MSVKLFKKILAEYPDTRKGLKKYLSNDHIELICDLINPPKNLPKDNEKWNLYGNRDKAFLFGIVSNPLNGLDVDKFEYMLRDADCSGVNIAFNKVRLEYKQKSTQKKKEKKRTDALFLLSGWQRCLFFALIYKKFVGPAATSSFF